VEGRRETDRANRLIVWTAQRFERLGAEKGRWGEEVITNVDLNLFSKGSENPTCRKREERKEPDDVRLSSSKRRVPSRGAWEKSTERVH